MALQKQDLIALSKADPKTMALDFNNRAIMTDPESRNRLVAEELIIKGGKLTAKGQKQFEKLYEKLQALRDGISLRLRKAADPKAIFDGEDGEWFMGEASKKPWVANTEVLFIGRKPDPQFNASKGTPKQRKAVPSTLRSILKGKSDATIELKPYAFQRDEFDGIELIWFRDDDETLFVPLQAKYFDYITDRFPKATYHVDENSDGQTAVQIRVKNQGIKFNCVGLVMPVKVEDFIPIPNVKG